MQIQLLQEIFHHTISQLGNPCTIVKERFNDEFAEYLEQIQWWNWDAEKIFNNLEILCSNDIRRIKERQ